jgi:hypothetical protein
MVEAIIIGRRSNMPTQSKEKWIGRAKQMVGQRSINLVEPPTVISALLLAMGMYSRARSRRIEASLEKSSRKPNLGQLVKS